MPFLCSACQKVFTTPLQVKAHYRMAHGAPPPGVSPLIQTVDPSASAQVPQQAPIQQAQAQLPPQAQAPAVEASLPSRRQKQVYSITEETGQKLCTSLDCLVKRFDSMLSHSNAPAPRARTRPPDQLPDGFYDDEDQTASASRRPQAHGAPTKSDKVTGAAPEEKNIEDWICKLIRCDQHRPVLQKTILEHLDEAFPGKVVTLRDREGASGLDAKQAGTGGAKEGGGPSAQGGTTGGSGSPQAGSPQAGNAAGTGGQGAPAAGSGGAVNPAAAGAAAQPSAGHAAPATEPGDEPRAKRTLRGI